jgi:hypothetical protein
LGLRYKSIRVEQWLRSAGVVGNGVEKNPQGFRWELGFGSTGLDLMTSAKRG